MSEELSGVSRSKGTWWEQHPQWLGAEFWGFDAAGISYERDKDAFEQGVAQLHLNYPISDGETVRLTVTYPDLYPYFRPEVRAPALDLGHHQTPHTKGICLLGRATANWHISMTVAALLQDQMPKLLHTGALDVSSADSSAHTEIAKLEQQQAEPFGEYYPYAQSSIVLVERTWDVPSGHRSGTFVIAVDEPRAGTPTGVLRGAMVEIWGEDGELLRRAEPLMRDIRRPTRVEGVWIRSPQPIREFQADGFIKTLLNIHPPALTGPISRLQDGSFLRTWGVLYPEEVGHRVLGEGWVFVCAFSSDRHTLAKAFAASRAAVFQEAARAKAKRAKGRR